MDRLTLFTGIALVAVACVGACVGACGGATTTSLGATGGDSGTPGTSDGGGTSSSSSGDAGGDASTSSTKKCDDATPCAEEEWSFAAAGCAAQRTCKCVQANGSTKGDLCEEPGGLVTVKHFLP